MITQALLDDAAALLDACRAKQVKLATAESCTGGLISAVLTAIAGSSDVVERGFVTYSNEAKTELLGVPAELIGAVGAVSEPVAERMAEGALQRSQRRHRRVGDRRCRPRRRQCREAGGAGAGSGSRSAAAPSAASVICFPVTGPAIRVAAVEQAFALIRAQL